MRRKKTSTSCSRASCEAPRTGTTDRGAAAVLLRPGLLLAILSLLSACSGAAPATPTPFVPRYVFDADCADVPRVALPVEQLVIQEGGRRAEVAVEVAATDEQRSIGLMCRAEVVAGTGMVFQWDSPTGAGFWMYRTYVALDLVYIDADGAPVAFVQMSPCPRRTDETDGDWSRRCSEASASYRPGASFTMAVELPAGWLGSLGLLPSPGGKWRATLR